MRIVPVALGAALTLGLALVGCGPTPPPVTLPPEPSSTPLFASEEEALAAAEEVYGAYWVAADGVGHGGWTDVSPLESLVTSDAYLKEAEQAAEFSAKGQRLSGETTAQLVSVQSLESSASGTRLRAYACVDVSGTSIIDAEGKDITPENRPGVVALEVSFVSGDSGELRLDRIDPWSGASFC